MNEQYKDYTYLYQNNCILHRSMSSMARECGVSLDTIRYQMKKHGITPYIVPKDKPKLYNQRFLVADMYKEGYSPQEIANRFDTTRRAVGTILKQLEIPLRTMQEAQFNYNKKDIPKEMFDKEWLQEQHLNKSVTDIAKDIGVDAGTLRRQMQKLGIHTNTNSESKIGLMVGSKHPNWKGGKTPLSLLLREYWKINIACHAMKRDGYKCCLCGKEHTLNVHHIKHFKDIVDEIIAENNHLDIQKDSHTLYQIIIKDSRFTSVDNLITLCEDCHKKVHGKYNTISNQVLHSRKGSTTIESITNEKYISE